LFEGIEFQRTGTDLALKLGVKELNAGSRCHAMTLQQRADLSEPLPDHPSPAER
jgi:hypothetical protein